MAVTFTQIASVTVGSGGAASIDFTSIPSTYTDLCIKTSIKEETTNNFTAKFILNNSSTAADYGFVQLFGNGSGTGFDISAAQVPEIIVDPATYSGTTNIFGSAELYFSNYAGSSYKSITSDSVQEANVSSLSFQRFNAAIWRSTAAINRITISATGGDINQYSTATLYGISKS